jgi:putative membrane protein
MNKHWRSTARFGAVAFALAVRGAQAQTTLSQADQNFITTAAEAGHPEVAMGKEAAESKDADIRAFGNQMVQDHTQMNEELTALAHAKGATVPSSADLASQAKGAVMSVLPGKTFDSQYVSQQLKDHGAALELLEAKSHSGQAPQLKAFAVKYIPIVQKHIGELQELQKKPELQ